MTHEQFKDCLADYALLQDECVKCPAQPWVMVLPLVALLFTVAVVVRKLHKAVSVSAERLVSKKKLRKLRKAASRRDAVEGAASNSVDLLQQAAALMTLLSYTQAAASIASMDLGWPLEVRWFAALLRKVNEFDVVGAAAPECLAGTQLAPLTRWLLGLCVPLFLMFALQLSEQQTSLAHFV